MAFLISTTGNISPVIFDDLGARSFNHPLTDYDLLLEYSIDELLQSNDLQNAIDSNYKNSFKYIKRSCKNN